MTESTALITYKSEEKAKWEPGAGCDKLALVGVILKSKDDEDEDSRADELIKEFAGRAQLGAWVSGEDASCSGWRWCNGTSTIFICVDQANVVTVDDTGSAKCTKELSEPVHWKSSPWKLAEHAGSKADGWVQESARVTSNVDTQHEADTPAKCDSGPVSEAIGTRRCPVVGGEECLCEGGIT